ncbi:site-specific integrase [Mesonia sp.]|uniref:site-specific integrase n=1 Tax=Mesonia sp. TaxID=1960830 RepID=UPI003F99508E
MSNPNTFSVLFTLKSIVNSTINPIYARITLNGVRAHISTHRKTAKKNWNYSSGRIKGHSIEAKQINQYLDQMYFGLLDAQKELEKEKVVISAQKIKARFLGQDEKSKTLIELVEYHNSKYAYNLKPGTIKNYHSTLRFLKIFLQVQFKTEDIYLTELNYKFITEFEYFLRNHKSENHSPTPSNNGVMKHLERLKKISKLAVRLEWVEKDPFKNLKLHFDKVDKAFLSKNELEAIENYRPLNQTLKNTLDVFLFACYTGLSWIDIKKLTKDKIHLGIDGNRWIFTHREKTNTTIKIPLLDIPLRILKTYIEPMKDEEEVLPVYSNQKCNKYLKLIATECHINKNLTFHVARHTFATTVTLSNGVPIETVSKLLGHTKLATTQIYARVLENKISEDMDVLKSKLRTANNPRKNAK